MNLTPEAVCAPTRRHFDYVKAVRTSLGVSRILRQLVRRAVTLALTTTTLPKTADDVATIAEQIAKEMIP